MIRHRCHVCDRQERILPVSRRLRPLGRFRSGRKIYVCGAPVCREVAAEFADHLERIAPDAFTLAPEGAS